MRGSADRQFVDTNILVYAHDASSGVKHERARDLLVKLWETGNGCVSIQVLQEFYVVVVQKVAKPLHPDMAYQIVSDLSHWHVYVPDVEDILEAIRIHQRNMLSFWDSLIIRSAGALGCKILWTEDLESNKCYEGVRALNPFIEG